VRANEPAIAAPADHLTASGYTVADVARRLRVSPDKVRHWIAVGELPAVNVATVLCGKPLWRITPDGLAAFERRRSGGPPPTIPRRRRLAQTVDYYPD
jgi:excisionase family DNA binding protein